MTLEKKEVVDSIVVLEDGQLQVRKATVILDDGVEVARYLHRHVVEPGDDTTNEDPRVDKVAKALHTKAVVSKFKLMREGVENAV